VFNQVRIVLVETSHPGNIGASARAMKNMGFNKLVLVNPCDHLCSEAIARSSGAGDLLESALVVKNLTEALTDCQYVIGASARLRAIETPVVNARQGAHILKQQSLTGEVAVVFGRERTGLTNSELDHCQQLLNIPTQGDYFSLNLAMAVQVVSYELLMAFQDTEKIKSNTRQIASSDILTGLFEHLDQMLIDIGFADKRYSNKLFRRLKRLFYRAELDTEEVNLLRGIFSAAQGRKSMKKRGENNDKTRHP